MPAPAADVLDLLLNVLADRVADRLAARGAVAPAPATPEFATAKHNPLGSSRHFLDAAREGRFPSTMRGRERVAKWEDVVAYDRERLRPRPPKKAPAPPPPAPRTEADLTARLRAKGLLPH